MFAYTDRTPPSKEMNHALVLPVSLCVCQKPQRRKTISAYTTPLPSPPPPLKRRKERFLGRARGRPSDDLGRVCDCSTFVPRLCPCLKCHGPFLPSARLIFPSINSAVILNHSDAFQRCKTVRRIFAQKYTLFAELSTALKFKSAVLDSGTRVGLAHCWNILIRSMNSTKRVNIRMNFPENDSCCRGSRRPDRSQLLAD